MSKATNFAARKCATQAAAGRHAAGKAWSAMRILRRFTAADVAAVIEAKTSQGVAAYANQLTRAGYLSRVSTGGHGRHEPTRYRLIRDSGPLAPSIVKRATAVYDHNTCLEHPLP